MATVMALAMATPTAASAARWEKATVAKVTASVGAKARELSEMVEAA